VSPLKLIVGDILYDTASKDIGILVRRFESGDTIVMEEEAFTIAAWEIYWMNDGMQFYSEYGLTTRLSSDDFLLLGHI